MKVPGIKTLMAGAPEMAQMMAAISEDMKRQGFDPRKGFRMAKDGKILARRPNRSVGEFHLPDDLPAPIRVMFDDIQRVIAYLPGDDEQPIVDLIQHRETPPLPPLPSSSRWARP